MCCAIMRLRSWESIVLIERRADPGASPIPPMQRTPAQCSVEVQQSYQRAFWIWEGKRVISVVRHSAVKTKTQAINQVRTMLISAPRETRERLLKTKAAAYVPRCARLRALGTVPTLQTSTVTPRLFTKL